MTPNAQITTEDEMSCHVLSSLGKKLFLKDDRADVHFIFDSNDGERIEIPAHKFLLIESSDVFRTMFNGLWTESSEVEIVDASADGFKEFLQFFYLDKVKLTMENVAEVMYLGHKYDVDDCLSICSEFLKNKLDESNICWGYKLAITYEQENLKKFCEKIIWLKTKDVLMSDGFLRCDFDVLSNIVALKSLTCSECELFEACMRRIETLGDHNKSAKEAAECETRKLLKIFRFGSMSLKEWSKLSPLYFDFFTFDEYREIIHLIGLEDFQATKLNSNRLKRVDIVPYNENDKIRCDRWTSSHCSCQVIFIKDVEITIFSTNQTVMLHTIVFGEIYEGVEQDDVEKKLSTEFTVFEMSGGANSTNSDDRVALYSGKAELTGDITDIMLKKPILIRAALKYQIHMTFEQFGSKKYTLWTNLKPEVTLLPDFTVQFFQHSNYCSRGLVEELHFIKI